MKLTSFRVFILLCSASVLLIVAAVGLTYGASKMLASQGGALTEAKINDAAARGRQDNLLRAQGNIAEYEELYTIARGVLPQEKDQVRTVREILNLAAENDITLTGITFPASTLGSTQKNTSAAKVDVTQLTPVKGVSGLYVMPITVAAGGGNPSRYTNVMGFVQALQSNRRTANIVSISATPDKEDRSLISFSIIINAYIRP